MAVSLHQLLKTMTEMGGTDLHVTTNSPPQIRVDGKLRPLDLPPLDRGGDQAARLQRAHRRAEAPLRGEPRARLQLRHQGPGPLPRQRLHAAGRGGGRLPHHPLRDPELRGAGPAAGDRHHLRQARAAWCWSPAPPAPGKSTTLAAMLDKINSERHEHIITIEDPIEYLHQHKKCVVNQRELHADTHSFTNALRAALREDPDVVLIGEMRDLETIESALRIAETGHLTFATLHTNSAASDHQPHRRRVPRPPAVADPRPALHGAGGHHVPVAAAQGQRHAGAAWPWRSWSPTRPSGTSSARTRSTRSTPPCRPARRSSACRPSTRAWPASTSRSRSPCRPPSAISSMPDELQDMINRGAGLCDPAVRRPAARVRPGHAAGSTGGGAHACFRVEGQDPGRQGRLRRARGREQGSRDGPAAPRADPRLLGQGEGQGDRPAQDRRAACPPRTWPSSRASSRS